MAAQTAGQQIAVVRQIEPYAERAAGGIEHLVHDANASFIIPADWFVGMNESDVADLDRSEIPHRQIGLDAERINAGYGDDIRILTDKLTGSEGALSNDAVDRTADGSLF